MARKNYNVDEVLRILSKKHDIKINVNTKHLEILKHNSPNAACDLGNKSWGKVDFLVNYQGYTMTRVARF